MHKFELENVLNYRVHLEETRKTEFNEIKRTVEIENRCFKENVSKFHGLSKDMEEKMQTGIPIKECRIYFSCIDHLHQTLIDKRKMMDGLNNKLSKKRDELIQAVQDRKIIEKLRENRIRDTIYRENKEEINSLDEFSTQRNWNRHTERE
jgi:flagellar protein FliJ